MSEVTLLRGWHWRPTWTLRPDPANPAPEAPWIPTWSGFEYLHDAAGNQIFDRMDGTGWGPGSGAAVFRKAPPPDRPVPTREEMEANRAREGNGPSRSGGGGR